MVYINRLFFNFINRIRNIYLNSNFYDRKISKVFGNNLIYKPSPHLLSSLIKYQKQKFKIEDFALDEIWDNKNISTKDFKRLNNFYWFFSLDLKSSNISVDIFLSLCCPVWINNVLRLFSSKYLRRGAAFTKLGLVPTTRATSYFFFTT